MRPKNDAFVLLPALLCDSRLYEAQINALSADFPVIVPDISDFDSFADMAQHVLKHAPPKFALGGNSMGGYLAFEILRQAPDRVTHLLLMGTNAMSDPPEAKEKREQAIRLAKRGKLDQFIETYVTAALYPAHVSVFTPVMVAMAKRLGARTLINHQRAIMARVDSGSLLASISVPTAVIYGAQDQLGSAEQHKAMAMAIPGASFNLVEGCGHLVPLEAPEVVSEAMRALVAR